MNELLTLQLVAGAAIGLGAGYLGSLMVLRRMSLVGDALSHVALPGIALALLAHIDPFIGAFSALILAVIGIWLLSRHTSLPSETLVGIFFTLALAIGILITPEPELLEALFGNITDISQTGTVVIVGAVLAMILIIRRIRPTLMLDMLSRDLAIASGFPVARVELIFLLLVALIVALGLRIAGTLLTGSLVIIPAAAARNISPSLSQYSLMSALFGAFSAVAGILAADVYSLPPGPLVILVGGLLFAVTVPFRK
jgi:ABC-type Mn2+/Zn2+ transport system permease subunit